MKLEKTKIISSKGELAAMINHPDEATERLAILCPGYLDSKDYRHLVALAEALSEQGYTVVRFDPTGTWESQGDIADYTTTQYLIDIKNVLENMLKRASYKQILLGGHSRGGQVSILYAARDSRISVVLGIMPSSERTMVGSRYDDWKKNGFSVSSRNLPNNKNEKKEFSVPYSHVEDRKQYSVIKDAEKIIVPIIILAGELDILVPPKDAKEIFDNANEPKKFIIIPGIGHDFRRNAQEIKIVNQSIINQLSNL